MIKLKSLINITEQAPQPPVPGAPVPLQTPPSNPEPAPEEQPIAPEPEGDLTPSPEDPGEYDWTKDFRAFEDAKNKAESQAKKKLLDKMNKSLIGKKATTNASRGYGQPKTDYTIDKIKKVSVEFWYKEWVVIVTDDNDKKYFLTPGVNIKIEQGTGEEGGPDDQAPTEPDAAQTGATGEEQPNPQPPAGSETGMPPNTGMGAQLPMGAGSPTPADPNAQPQPQIPGQPPVPQQPTEQPPVEDPLKKKKKLSEKIISNWTIGKDLRLFLTEHMSNEAKNKKGQIDFTRYIKNTKSMINESRNAEVYRCRLEIPINHLKQSIDIRDIKLSAKEKLFSSGNVDQRFSRGSVDISKVGRIYVMDFVKQTGWKS